MSMSEVSTSTSSLTSFRQRVLIEGARLYRDLPWRKTHDPYAIWISEVMLQQTQVKRVDGRWQQWLEKFPTVDALALASRADVLEEWQGMGYNRRALSLLEAARRISKNYPNSFPTAYDDLVALPGIGPATAAGIRAFAFDLPGVYLETNVRSVFLHELFPDAQHVPDSVLIPLVRETCPQTADNPSDTPRIWYYALLDVGAELKRTHTNPSRRSKTYARQSKFEGSHRQKRAEIVRILLAQGGQGLMFDDIVELLNGWEEATRRESTAPAEVQDLLNELLKESMCSCLDERWHI